VRTKILFTTVFILCGFLSGYANSPKDSLSNPREKRFYFYWGYNRSIFSRSNIHVHGKGYDFTVYNVKSKDHPENPSLVYVKPSTFSIPQFNVRAGYFITKRWALSLGYDHMKYIMVNDQRANVSGVITQAASEKYAGTYLNKPMIISYDFLKFEHTDGLNVITLDLEHHLPLWNSKNNKWKLNATMGIGSGGVLPRSDVRVLGYGLNNRFHWAGTVWTGKAGLRINGFKRFFFQTEVRGGYISLPSVLVHNEAADRADHFFSYLEFTGVVGFTF
jgi:hypothetical protein